MSGVTYPAVTENYPAISLFSCAGSYRYYTDPAVTRIVSSSRIGVREPNRFAFTRINGYLPQHAYTARYFKESRKATSYWAGPFQFGLDMLGCGLEGRQLPFVSDLSHLAAVRAYCASQCTAKLNSRVKNQYYSTFETLYEGRKTKQLILNTVRTTYRALTAVRRFRFKEATQLLGLKSTPRGVTPSKSTSSNWLAYRYGWGPLYSTVYGAMQQAYDRIKSKEPIYQVSDVYSSDLDKTSIHSGNITLSGGSQPLGMTVRTVTTNSASNRTKVKYIYRVHNPGVASSTSMGLTNPALVAWELTPLSFVADWFLNVSDVLEQMDAWSGKTFLTGTITHTTQGEVRVEPYVVNTLPTGQLTDIGYYSGSYTDILRTLLVSPPAVMPVFQLSLTNKRIVDAIALLTQASKRA